MSTLFERIVSREIPAEIVYETDTVLAFRDINSQAPTHVLVVPKKPITDLNAATVSDAALLGELLLAAQHVARLEQLSERGYRVVINTGDDAGMAVPHLHLHVLGGRHLAWPPG